MSPESLFAELKSLGASLRSDGERLVIDAPSGVVYPALRAQISGNKGALLRLLNTTRIGGEPARGTPGPNPPSPDEIEEDLADVLSRFAAHGTCPAADDIAGALSLERKREWCSKTLEALYRGELTLAWRLNTPIQAFSRGCPS